MHKYRSMIVWQRSHDLVLCALKETDKAYHPRSRALFDQLRRAAISVECNLVEGYALGTPPLFRRHLRIAFGSAAEAECEARAARELGYLPDPSVDEIENLLSGAMRAIYGLMISPPVIRSRHRAGSNHPPMPDSR